MLQTCHTSESNQTEIEDPRRRGIRHDMTVMPATNESHRAVCILYSANCGVGLRSEGREITCLRGNKSRLASLGYTSEKALRLNHHQNGMKRLQSPMMRSTTTRSLAPRWKKEPSVSSWLTRKRLRRSVAHILIIDESVSALWRCCQLVTAPPDRHPQPLLRQRHRTQRTNLRQRRKMSRLKTCTS